MSRRRRDDDGSATVWAVHLLALLTAVAVAASAMT
ncbi:MAG: hypothetical protein JWO46_485, partial [Nocardioidaceae bacterium]|nr:hypothetical protein [Nocardioidaceae bacterium]